MDGWKLQVTGHLNEAIDRYAASVECYPTAEALTFWGYALSFTNDYRGAIEKCEYAIQLDPEFGNPYNDIGAYYISLNELENAKIYLTLALDAPRYATPHFPRYNLGRIAERQGLWFDALKWFKDALAHSADYTLAKDSYYRMQALLN